MGINNESYLCGEGEQSLPQRLAGTGALTILLRAVMGLALIILLAQGFSKFSIALSDSSAQ